MLSSSRKAKELIGRIMNKGHDIGMGGGGGGMRHGSDMMHDGGGGGGHQMVEMMIPGNKAGIIIGKGGDTIKQLQARIKMRCSIVLLGLASLVPNVIVFLI